MLSRLMLASFLLLSQHLNILIILIILISLWVQPSPPWTLWPQVENPSVFSPVTLPHSPYSFFELFSLCARPSYGRHMRGGRAVPTPTAPLFVQPSPFPPADSPEKTSQQEICFSSCLVFLLIHSQWAAVTLSQIPGD